MTPIDIFTIEVLKSQTLPADLAQLFELEQQRTDDEDCPLTQADFYICKNASDLLELHDKSYLSPKDLQDPEIQANVYAIDCVFKLITFVAFTDERNWFGYWHGTENTPLHQAPIVEYDNEGQFRLCDGKTMTEAIISYYAGYEEERFAEIKPIFARRGVHIQASTLDEITQWPTAVSPNDHHQHLYYQKRAQLGLAPLDN